MTLPVRKSLHDAFYRLQKPILGIKLPRNGMKFPCFLMALVVVIVFAGTP